MVAEPRIAPGRADELRALYFLALELSDLRDVDAVLDLALRQCLELTGSSFGFIGLTIETRDALEIVAIQGFHPTSDFYARHRMIPLRPNVFARAVLEDRPVRSVDASVDPARVGQPRGHPVVRTFLGAPLRCDDRPIGMIGVANRDVPYEDEHERLLGTYAAQVAIVIRNAQLYEELERTNEQLEYLVAERTRELRRTTEQLHRQAQVLASVLSETVDVQERERRRIAQELHDGVNQMLVGAMLELGSALRRIDEGTPATAVADGLHLVAETLRQVEGEIRRVVHDLHPPALVGLGLPAAVRRLAERFTRIYGIPCEVTVEGEPKRLGARREIHLYRVIQEALRNAGSHADASTVTVRLRFDTAGLTVSVADDGRGFRLDGPDAVAEHLGLSGMRWRAEALGGCWEVVTAPGAGTTVTVSVREDES